MRKSKLGEGMACSWQVEKLEFQFTSFFKVWAPPSHIPLTPAIEGDLPGW